MSRGTTAISILLSIPLCSLLAFSSDILTASESLPINQTLVSAARSYELGFFTPPGAAAGSFYLGIWYYGLPVKTYVWVANRDSPARASDASLKLGARGQILIVDHAGARLVWSTNQSEATNPVLQLLDSGNLVVREADDSKPGDYIWQSFDYPSDTLLPGQKLGWDKYTGMDRYLTSWSSSSDPSSGYYTFRLDRVGDPEIFILKSGSQRRYRSGPWVGSRFSGVPEMKPSTALNFTFRDEPDQVFYMFDLVDRSIKSRLMVDSYGNLNRFTWVADRQTWNLFWGAPKDTCDNYEQCGPYGVCNANKLLLCECPQGFEPRNPSAWALRDGSDGCERRTRLECGSDGFVVLRDMKLPECGGARVYEEKTLAECGEMCRSECGCTAYANSEVVHGVGSGCVMWTGDLVDMRAYSEGGQDLYVRVAASDLGTANSDADKTKKVILGVGVSVGVAMLLLIVFAGCFLWRKKHLSKSNLDERVSRRATNERSQDFLLSRTFFPSKREVSKESTTEDLDLPLYDFDAIAVATDNFSDENKLGQGGFGCVYKAVLGEDGEVVAVKRLSKDSGQGVEEFKNEVKLIAKLQHRNLVRLLGCCVDGEEKMLLYEYLPNRSLDSVLFHKERSCSLLDWPRRFNVICGIAKGLVYLHHDSRFRIIHRDLKASNILLDHDMNPKISDFGMARIFGGDETEANSTRRVVGTYGYMSPEYAMDGVFSIKSDVFSFGVLVLEIVTGKKNRGFHQAQQELNLLTYVWKMWKDGKGSGTVDPTIGDSYSVDEVLRCVQVGLLCVQERPEERPTMSTVALFLSTEAASLPQPKLPGFCLGWRPGETDSSSSRQDETFTANHVTLTTMMDGR